ncbi:DHH family phosphoesterase [Schinkia azotoformans]|uniref:DHH family phosphoesterase n=1 Tax=Schinkia azotoformans TaxID=1454 RepID=UPI002DBCF498|nr:oligoribonuclease [Schinkia azotoformans]MEC1718605.1 oligoribonuclease [Schinkia azotoformans]MEC1743587.1 oligoribonuclease [Schinkia azotoformans]MEC1748230.1 oligoribonuclease [Schinkia azotoformans]MEC1759488.1 oligoribonuclease [Schinkia azotoformans]MEC1768534.1 oligoribonuclease [Schinkia azotoformans]
MYKLLTHNDLDGVSCGILAKLSFGDEVNVRYNSNASLDREVESFLISEDKDTFLLITDLSVNDQNEKGLELFYQGGGKVQLIDHHKTALHLNKYKWGYVAVENDEGKLNSATSLFYEYLISKNLLQQTEALNEFVELVRQYDTWEWEKNDNQLARRLNALFYLLSIEEFEEIMINRLQTSDHFYFDDFEKKILDMEDDKIVRYIRRKRRELVQTEIGGYFAGIVYAESYHSELGNELAKDNPHLDYIAILNMGGKKLGFRTIHNHVDVSEVARKFGGGGHAKASGCPLTADTYKKFVTNTFPLESLRVDARENRFNLKESPLGSLYKDRNDDVFFIYPESDKNWVIERNKTKIKQTFNSFAEAEKYIKRKHEAWLVKDDDFVSFLMDVIRHGRKNQ